MSYIISKEINEIKLKMNEPIMPRPKRQKKKSKNESTSSSSESKLQRSYSTNKRENSLISDIDNTFGLSSSLIRKKKQDKYKDHNNSNKQQTHILTLQQQKQSIISDLKKQFLNILNAKPGHTKKASYRIKGGKNKQSHHTNHTNVNHANTHSQSNITANTTIHYHHHNSNNHATSSIDYTLSTLPQVSIDLNATKDLSVSEVKEMTDKLKQLNDNQLKQLKPSYIKELKNLHKVIENRIALSKSINYNDDS